MASKNKALLQAKVTQLFGDNWELVWFRGHRAGKGEWLIQVIDKSNLSNSDPRHRSLGYNLRQAHRNMDVMVKAGSWVRWW